MGYTTEFKGQFNLSRKLTLDEFNILNDLQDDGDDDMAGCPDSYCQRVPTKDGLGIKWDGGEKFYNYTERINFIAEHFLKKWGISLSGEVSREGEEIEDIGILRCVDLGVIAIRLKPKGIKVCCPECDHSFYRDILSK